MTSLVIEILVQHDFLNSLGVTGERKTIIGAVKQHKPTMLSYAKSSPRTRIDDAAYVATNTVKERRTQLNMSLPRESSPYRLLPRRASNSDDLNSSRTYHDREELRDDTLAHQTRTDWIAEQDRQFQSAGPPPPPPFQPQRDRHIPPPVDSRVLRRYQPVDEHDWNAAQHAAQQAIRGQHSSLRHVYLDTEVNPRYASSLYPVAQSSHGRGGYVMQMNPTSSSFEQIHRPQANHVILSSQESSPMRRYEAYPHRQHPSLLQPERYSVQLPSSRASPASPQRRVTEGHAIRTDTEWHGQRVQTFPRRMVTSKNAASNVGLARSPASYQQVRQDTASNTGTAQPPASYQQPARVWQNPSRQEVTKKEQVERNAISVAEMNLAQSSSSLSSREWRDPNVANSAKPTPMTIELKPSGHSDISSSSSLGATSQSTEATAPTAERVDGSTKRPIGSAYDYPPVISEDSPQQSNYQQQAPAKRMKPAYDPRSETTPNSLELLCSATLDLGPLQENATGCSCPRSHCIKLYCDCFKAGRRCSSKCSCTNCKNTPAESGYNGERTRAIRNILARNPRAFTGGNKKEGASRKPGDLVCNCVKSKCLKLYCECFQKGKLCNDACSCVSCLNTEQESHVGGRRKLAIQQALEKRPDAFTKKPKEVGSGCACKNNRCLKKYCDCFRFGLNCTDKCTCRECENMAPSTESQVTAVAQV